MACGIKVGSIDLDLIFKARATTKGPDLGYKSNGAVDISNRFEKSSGGDQISYNTNIKNSSGTDLKEMLQDYDYTPAEPLSATLSNSASSASNEGAGPFTTSPAITASGSGGTPGYSFLWTQVSGDATIAVSSSTDATVTWSASGTPQETKTAAWKCTITDSVASTSSTSNVTVTLIFNTSSLGAVNDKSAVSSSGSGAGVTLTSDAVTVTPSGGTPGYTYLWARQGGTLLFDITSPTASSTTFYYTSSSVDDGYQDFNCRVTDSLSNVVYTSNVRATFTWT